MKPLNMSKQSLLSSSLVALFMLLNLGHALANANTEVNKAPEEVLKSITYNLIEALKKSKKTPKQDPQIIHAMVATHIAPKLDFIAASRWVLGKYWRHADRAQKIRFIKEFRSLLIRFYSSALAEYALTHEIDHSIMRFLPVRENDSKDVTVHSIVSPPNSNKKVAVNYNMHKTRKGWKIYDVTVEGISMITTYKSSFAPQLRNEGIEALINSMTKRNQKLSMQKVSLNTSN